MKVLAPSLARMTSARHRGKLTEGAGSSTSRCGLSTVLVVSSDPVGPAAALVSSLRHQIQVVIVQIQLVVAAIVARVRMKHDAALVFVEDAVPLPLARVGSRMVKLYIARLAAISSGVNDA